MTQQENSTPKAGIDRVNPSTTIVKLPKYSLLFSYTTLVAIWIADTGMNYIAIKDRAGDEFGTNGGTTKKAINAFVGGKWQDAVKNGKAVVKTLDELEAML